VRQEFRTPEHCFVAWLGDDLVGYVSNDIDLDASRGRIANLAVHRDHRSKGIGRILIERSIEHFRELGLKQAKIETLAVNEVGNHLYPKLGFKEVARQVHFAMNL
jgi:ribosomal protein S18 acetylase RimI-like enzyme